MYENCKLTKKMNSKFKERAWSKICPYLWNNAQLKFYPKEKLDPAWKLLQEIVAVASPISCKVSII